jgi:DNA-binding transcriptional ArsR family regulator
VPDYPNPHRSPPEALRSLRTGTLHMSTRLVGWALRDAPVAHPNLTTGARLLLIYLADHFNEDEGAAWPSHNRLANLLGCSKRSINNWLEELLEAGIIAKTRRSGTSTLYRFQLVQQVHTPVKQVHSTSARGASRVRTTCTLTNKELITNSNETQEAPLTDPEEIADTLDRIRQEIFGRRVTR